jgi:4-methyl-5(b-hydroxyethyl)-thiazole monophosphate biosynthesis
MRGDMSILVLVAEGFEEVELVTPVDIWRRAGEKVVLASINGERLVKGAHGIVIESDDLLRNIDQVSSEFDFLFLPGGNPGYKNLAAHPGVLKQIRLYLEEKRWIGAICAAPLVLQEAQVLNQRMVTSYPGVANELKNVQYQDHDVVYDENIITSRGAGTAVAFALASLKALGKEKEAQSVAKAMLYR